MVFRKGSGLHGAAGTIFFLAMLSAAGAGAILAGFLHPNDGNVMGSTLTLYLVSTAWMAARRRDGKPGLFDVSALLFALAIAAAGATWGRAPNIPYVPHVLVLGAMLLWLARVAVHKRVPQQKATAA